MCVKGTQPLRHYLSSPAHDENQNQEPDWSRSRGSLTRAISSNLHLNYYVKHLSQILWGFLCFISSYFRKGRIFLPESICLSIQKLKNALNAYCVLHTVSVNNRELALLSKACSHNIKEAQGSCEDES